VQDYRQTQAGAGRQGKLRTCNEQAFLKQTAKRRHNRR